MDSSADSSHGQKNGAGPSSREGTPIEETEGTLRRFWEEWTSGRRPSIESVLSGRPESESTAQLRKLLEAELGFLLSTEVAPDFAEYRRRFPTHGDSISTVADESGLGTVASEQRVGLIGDSAPPTDAETASFIDHQDEADIGAPTGVGGLPGLIGRYQIVKLLGAGAFGCVYQAFDAELKRHVALKTPRQQAGSTSVDVESYLNEARNLARLDHPGIVPVYDFGRGADGSCFLVSKVIHGSDLARRLRRCKPAQCEAATLIAAVADAVHYAHSRGLVHRDIKPRNILLDEAGKPYLADFGLALREEDFGHGPNFAGTPVYMSPEQARGEGHLVDGRSDIFSLGMVLYELLTGERPFKGADWKETLELIKTTDARPPSELDPTIAPELERICLKALSKRITDRCATALEMAQDLLRAVEHLGESAEPLVPARAGNAAMLDPSRSVPVVPKGLRCFDAGDAGFFLGLLPGPRDREGLPERLRFWKSRIEETDGTRTFRVGVVYGPSGCGKSSMVRAGLLPRLAGSITRVLVEAAPAATEDRLLAALRTRFPQLPPGLGPAQSLAALRRGEGGLGGGKLLIVIDQFEQWLNANPAADELELVQALRQCDGARVQCLLMVRDDFWMSLSRFMQELDVSLAEGQNCAAADLFDLSHAAKVLTLFGRAFEALPPFPKELSREQSAFVTQAVAALSQDGRLVPIHLSLFAEMVKGREWKPATLRTVGGPQGIGVAFLDEAFASRSAPHERHLQRRAAREALKLLLPEPGEDIRGHQRTRGELLRAAGYADGSRPLDDLLRVLDAELRLITPVDPRDAPRPEGSDGPYYQLTHDYLVPSIREWVTRQQMGTRKGRAEVLLAERTALWVARPEPRYLPSTVEWLAILWHTRPRERAEPQRRMLKAAAGRFGRNGSLIGLGALSLILGALYFRSVVQEEFRTRQAESALQRLLVAETSEIRPLLGELGPYRARLNSALERLARESPPVSKARLVAALALVDQDPSQAEYLRKRLLAASPDEAELIIETLRASDAQHSPAFWSVAEGVDSDRAAVLRAGCALAALAPRDARWESIAPAVAQSFVEEHPFVLPGWIRLLRPASGALAPALGRLLEDPERNEAERSKAAEALAEYLADDGEKLAALVLDAPPEPFRILSPRLAPHRMKALALFAREIAREAAPDWEDHPQATWTEPDRALRARIESAQGFLTPAFACCQALPLSELENLVQKLVPSGFRLSTLRPYRADGDTLAAVVWVRDGRDIRMVLSATADELRSLDQDHRAEGFFPIDLAYLATDSETSGVYTALWAKAEKRPLSPWADELLDASLYVAVPEERHAEAWGALNQGGFVPKTNFLVEGPGGKPLFNSLRWKFKATPRYCDTWDDADWDATLARVDAASDRALFVADVHFDQVRRPSPQPYATIWWAGGDRLGAEAQGMTPAKHLARSHELTAAGYRPSSLSVSARGGTEEQAEPTVSSTWIRPVVAQSRQETLARRQANAVIASFHLGHAEPLWQALRRRSDPRLRSLLVTRLRAFDVSPRALLDRLGVEPVASVRSALLKALAGYDFESLPRAERSAALEQLRKLGRDAPEPDVHSSAELVLKRWGQPSTASSGPFTLENAGARSWYVDSQGQTLVILRGPLAFTMGSPGAEDERDHHREMLHEVRLDRSLAVATTEVTVEQFRRFDPKHSAAIRFAPEPDCPVNMILWVTAARYCNWRSEQEGVPRDQWCYPDPLGPDSALFPRAQDRIGYRLPTEVEWEYFARAGATTSRYFGQSDSLLPLYAWTVANAQYRSWPVGRLLPNAFGLFDVLGNVLEWCHDQSGPAAEHSGPSTALDADALRAMRGGSFLYMPSSARSAQRHENRVIYAQPYIGLRVVRTLPPADPTRSAVRNP